MKKALLVLNLFIFLASLNAQMKRFDHLDVENGLSQNTVNCIFKDTRGYLWIGTNDGLNKYDGYSFKVYKNKVEDPFSLSNNKVYCMLEDKSGTLWIGTSNGLNVYNKNKDHFEALPGYPQAKNLNGHFIRSLFEDSKGVIWVGTLGQGLLKWSPNEQAFVKVPLKINPTDSEGNNEISSIFEDQKGNFWVTSKSSGVFQLDRNSLQCRYFPFQTEYASNAGSKVFFEDQAGQLWVTTEGQGVFYLEKESNSFQQFNLLPNNPRNRVVKGIIEDEYGHLWLGTDGGGIFIYDPQTKNIQNLRYDFNNSSSIGSNGIYTLFKDDQGIIWIGTFDGGVSIFNKHNKLFNHLSVDARSGKGLSHRSVLCFLEDHQNRVWLGTDGGGLNCFYPKSQKFEYYDHLSSEENNINNKVITSLHEDEQHRIWLGTYRGGLQCFIPGQGITKVFLKDKEDPFSIRDNDVWSIVQDKNNHFWIGTLGGLDHFDPETETFKHIQTLGYQGTPLKERVTELYVDQKNKLWVGGKGLRYYDEEQNQLKLVAQENDQFLSQFDIREFYEDNKGNFWIGTEGGGLYLFDRKTYELTRFTTSNGLPSNVIHNILEAEDQTLWISTNNGLCKLNPESLLLESDQQQSDQFRSYCIKDGLQSNQFSYNAGLKTNSGWLYFGGINGFNYFNPNDIQDNVYKPSVEITAIKIFDEYITPEQENSILEKNISELSSLTLNHSQNQMFSFEFTALNFTSSDKNQYAYKLDGFMDEWSYIGSQRSVTFTNLNPGHYILRVKAANNDGLWNEEEKILHLNILPPFWKTNTAYAIYLLVFIGLLYAFRRIMLARERLKHDLKIKELEKQKVEEVNRIKLSFFTDISHEFRTPLTLIQAPIDELLSSQNLNNNEKIQAGLVKKNTKRLLRLVDQLLEFRKINDKKLTAKPEQFELIGFLRQIIEAFKGHAIKKDIQLSLESELKALNVVLDADKVEKVIYNLLSNAFKYTNHTVVLRVKLEAKDSLILSVEDDGIGIPESDQAFIFNRYYKVEANQYGSDYKVAHGTGIGLAYSKVLTEVMDGQISVKSQLGEGSTFLVTLPLVTKAKKVVSTPLPTQLPLPQEFAEADTNESLAAFNSNKAVAKKGNLPLLLIVEDHEELRWTLKNKLSKSYRILEAADGEEGIQMGLKHLPDIIISDIMMPRKDGIELCSSLKVDDRTSHIPILLLTANTNEEKCLSGFNTGAEAYITKPFKFNILEARLRSVLNTRKRLKKYFSSNIIRPGKVEIPSADDQFLQKAIKIIEEHIDNSEFGVNEFAKALGMSRSVLYRKFSMLIEYPVKEFINMIRLKRAAQIFDADPKALVATVAYSVGFTDAQYFSKKFKKFYNKTPTQYINRNRESSAMKVNSK
ncbi:MAG: two-component regulator propeller domain-containing protein [Bacteroidota bacterium]